MCPRSAARSPAPPRTLARVVAESPIRSLAGLLSQGRGQAARCAPFGSVSRVMGTRRSASGLDPGRRVSGPSHEAACQQRAGCWRARPDDSFGRAVVGGAGWRVDRAGRWAANAPSPRPRHSLAGIEADGRRRAGSKDAESAIRMHVISRMRAGAPASQGAQATASSARGRQPGRTVIAWRRLCGVARRWRMRRDVYLGNGPRQH